VVTPKYDRAGAFSEGMAAIIADRKVGFIDKNGREIVVPQYYSVHDFTEGLAAVRGFDGQCGYIDTEGRVVAPLKYYLAESFSEGLAVIMQSDPDEGFKWGYINTEGQEVVTPQYDYAEGFSGGRAVVRLDGKWGIIGITEEMPITETPALTLKNADKAEALKPLGVFVGTEKGFELERPATRMEAAVMLTRLLGKEE
jgi:hypothetical protein